MINIKNIITKILLKFINVSILFEYYQKIQISNFKKVCTLGKDSKLYPETQIQNFKKDNKALLIGSNSHVRAELLILPYSKGIRIGDNCYIGERSVIRSFEKITIGNNVLIAHNVNIIDSDSHEISAQERINGYNEMLKYGHMKRNNIISKEIIINDYVWLSYNVSILKGVTIGKGAIVAAGSIVTKDVEPYTMVAGNPAKFIKNLPKV